jgi:predicted ribosome quality control (RQC) complex YloA/Tae2 family protein
MQETKMADKSKGGSGSGDNLSKNKFAKISMDQAFAKIETLTSEVEEKDELISELSSQLEEANKVLESQEKGKLIGEILPRSSFKMDELLDKSVDDLQNIRATLDLAMPPKVNSVRFGVLPTDLSDREKGLTVGDLSVVTAAKRKGAVV